MSEILKNASKEFGKKAGKALGNALFGEYGEDKRIGIRYTEGTTTRRRGRPSNQDISAANEVARIEAEQKLLEARIEAENDRLEQEREAKREAAVSARLAKKASELTSIEFNEDDPKQIVRQLSKLASVVELTLKNDDDSDDGLCAAAESQFATGLAMLKAIKPDHAMISHFEDKQIQWEKDHRKKWWSDNGIVFVGIFILLLCIIFPLYMAYGR